MLVPLLALPLALAPQSGPAAQQAQPQPTFSYNFVEVGFFRSNIENVSQDAKGWGLRGSYDIVPGINVIGSFNTQSTDLLGGELELTDYAIGIGSHHAAHPKLDFYGSLDFRWQDRETLGVSNDDTGYGFTAGLRGLPHERIELGAALIYSYVSTSNTDLDLNARGYITEKLSLGASVAFGDDRTLYGLGLRFNI